MDDSKTSNTSPDKPTDKDYKKKRIEEIGSTLAQIKARVKANRSCARKDDDSKTSPREILSEKSEKYIQVLELDKAIAQKLEKERPKFKEALENLKIDREKQKLVEKKIEETRAKQSAPLPEIPVEVQKRISDLEITIHNLKETLSEKERVLESKTESWRLLSDQLEQKNMEAVDKYEMMAKEMDEAKKSYAEQEVFLRSEMEKYKAKLHEADSQLISQKNLKEEEEASKVELEEVKQIHSKCEEKMGEFERTIEAEKKLCLKLKAQIKNYRNQINSKKDLSGEVERLQNRVATLEEEKEAACRNLERVNQLESTLKTTEADLISTREQCDRVNDDYKDLCLKLIEKEEVIKSLNESLEKMEQSKIASEFKAAELEEKLESENREDRAQNDKMCKEMDNLKKHVKQQEDMVEELRNLIQQKEEEIQMINENRDMGFSFGYDTQDLKDLLEEWKSKYTRIENNVRIVEEEKETLLAKVESLQVELENVNDRYKNVIAELSQKDSLIDDYVRKNKELVESLSQTSEKVKELEEQLSNEKKTEPKSKSDDHTQKLKKLAANLRIKVKLCKELEEKVNQLNGKIVDQENSLSLLTNEKSDLESLVCEYKMKLENISVDTDVVEQLKNLLSEKEMIIKNLTEEEGLKMRAVESKAIQRTRTESQCELVEKESTIKHLREENLILESKLNENMAEIHSVSESEKTSTPSRNIDSATECNLSVVVVPHLDQIKLITQELETKIQTIAELERTVAELNSNLEKAYALQNETKNQLDVEVNLVGELRKELDSLKNAQGSFNLDLSDKSELLDQIRSLQVQIEDANQVISNKETTIDSIETELNSLKSEFSKYENDSEKFVGFYNQLSDRNNQVGVQLDEVSAQFVSSLQEKDLHINKLESDLNNMKDKYQSLELTINERQKAMEVQAQKLGEKLNEASAIGTNFEQYQADMKQLLIQHDETKMQLNMKIEELTQMNSELEISKSIADNKVLTLEGELTDLQTAYNTTLDQIEHLNGVLSQVMTQVVHRNEELERIGEERNSLLGRLSELEGTCGDLRCRLQQYEEQSVNLKSELDNKLKELDLATAEITNLQSQLGTSQLSENVELNRELEVLKTDYEEKLRELQVEKDDLIKVIKGSVESEVDSLMKAAEDKVDQKQELKVFSWEPQTESGPLGDLPDDSWGWNASDAKLAEEYQNSEANKLKLLKEEKKNLQLVNEKLEENVKSLKLKCSKLIAKVKELKANSEKSKSKTGFEDLDFAMQEELRSNLEKKEKETKDLQSEISTMKTEKERLLKRIETLTSANNQLIEMKERQDIEVQVWQRNCADLKNQLQSFDWNESESKEVKNVLPVSRVKSDSELEDKLTFLETENEELLQIICSLKDEKQANNNLVTELNNLKEENQKLKNKETSLNQDEINQLKQLLESEQLEVKNKMLIVDRLSEEKNGLEYSLNSLKNELKENQEKYDLIKNQINSSSVNTEQMQSEFNSLKSDLDTKMQEINALNETICSLKEAITKSNEENASLKMSGNNKDLEISKLNEQLNHLNLAVKQIENLQSEQFELSNEIENLKSIVDSLTDDNKSLRSSYDSKVAEINFLKAELKSSEESKESALRDIHNLQIDMSETRRALQSTLNVSDPPHASLLFGDASTPPASSLFHNVSYTDDVPPASSLFGEPPLSSSLFDNKPAPSVISDIKPIEDFKVKDSHLMVEIERLKSVIETFTLDKENLLTSLQSKVKEIDLLQAELKQSEASKTAVINDLENLQHEMKQVKNETVDRPMNPSEPPPASSLFSNISTPFASSLFGSVSTPPASSLFCDFKPDEKPPHQNHLIKEIDDLKLAVDSLTHENETLRSSYDAKVAEIDLLQADMKMNEASRDAAVNDMLNLREELNRIKIKNQCQPSNEVKVSVASSFFSQISEPVFTQTFNDQAFTQKSQISTAPFDMPDVNQSLSFNIARSPPVFKGFFSDQNDPFAQQLNITTEVPQDVLDSSTGSPKIDSNLLQTLKDKIINLEDENSKLLLKIERFQERGLNEEDPISKKISEQYNEIVNLNKHIHELHEKIKDMSERFQLEKTDLVKANEDLMSKIREYHNSAKVYEQDLIQTKMELEDLRLQQINETEQKKNDEEVRRLHMSAAEVLRDNNLQAVQKQFEEQLLQNERNFQNVLLNKDEENAHLVCDASAKQALCDKLTTQIKTMKSELSSLENDLKSTKELNDVYSSEINAMRQNVDKLNFENGELMKIKESDAQQFAAQIDYLQQSVQEKDSYIEGLSLKHQQISEQITSLQEEVRISQERSTYFENLYSSVSGAYNQQTADLSAVSDRLRAADEEIEHLSVSIATLTQELNEHKAKLEQEKFSNESLRGREAEQVRLLSSEIEILQSSITEKDLEIERLSKLLTGLQEKLIKAEEGKISDEVKRLRGKLDEALYTVHLRDTRCDELTVEIMHLLGERDALQLRLSEALRLNETLKESSSLSDNLTSPQQPPLPIKSTHHLDTKVGEVQTGYMKDPAVREDRENRHSQQMHLFTSNDSTPVISAKKPEPATSDYGILNWFFSSSTSPQASQEEPGT